MKRQTTLFLSALVLTLIAALPLQAKKSGQASQKVYIFGFAASFNDTIVHFTDVQELDSAVIDSKTGFLQGRDQYSSQLREHLATHSQLSHRTCITVFNTNRSKLEKAYVKMKKQYTQGKNQFDVRYISGTEFRYHPADVADIATTEQPAKAPNQPKGKRPGKGGPRPPKGKPAQ